MNSKKEILNRVKLLMKYEMGKTLEENYQSIDDLITEQPIPGLGRIFKIAGEELSGSLRNAIDDVMVFSRRYGGVEIKAADGSIKKATTSRELIDALHNGRITTKTLSELHGGLLKSLETPPNVIEHIISQPGFETAWKRQMGNHSPEQIVIELKQKGYPNEIIEKMMKKMGVQKTTINSAVKLTDDEIADMLKNLGGSFDRESVKTALIEFSKQRGLKLNSKQIEQVADDIVIELGKMNKNFRPEEFERIWTTKMTTKDKENLIKKVLASPPPGISGSDWGAYVTDALKSSGVGLGKGIGRIMATIWTKGLGYAGLYYGGSYLTGWYGDTKSVPGAIWNTVTWPYQFLKYMMQSQSSTGTNTTGTNTTGTGDVTSPLTDNMRKMGIDMRTSDQINNSGGNTNTTGGGNYKPIQKGEFDN
jgi:hypothetical protein